MVQCQTNVWKWIIFGSSYFQNRRWASFSKFHNLVGDASYQWWLVELFSPKLLSLPEYWTQVNLLVVDKRQKWLASGNFEQWTHSRGLRHAVDQEVSQTWKISGEPMETWFLRLQVKEVILDGIIIIHLATLDLRAGWPDAVEQSWGGVGRPDEMKSDRVGGDLVTCVPY